LCLIIVLLPQGKNPFAVKINNNKEDYKAEWLYIESPLYNYYVHISNKIALKVLLTLVYKLYVVGKIPLNIRKLHHDWYNTTASAAAGPLTWQDLMKELQMFTIFNNQLKGATIHMCTRPITYSLVVPALPLMATKAVAQLVSDKRVVSLGGAHYRTLLPWCCRIIHALAHPHPEMLNSCQILHQFWVSLYGYKYTVTLFLCMESFKSLKIFTVIWWYNGGNKWIAYQ
jgi:hypothetical protein